MCLTLPAKVLSVSDNKKAIILSGTKDLEISLGPVDDIKPGDWVLYTNEFLVKKVSEQDAREIFDLLSSYPKPDYDKLEDKFKNVLEVASRGTLTKSDLEYLLQIEDPAQLQALYSEANITRKANIKDHICIHGIIEFSNYCRNNCLYCGLRADNHEVQRYRLTPEEIVTAAVGAVDRGYKILVLQSGEDMGFSEETLYQIIKEIKNRCRVFLYLSIGDRPIEEYAKFRQVGAGGVLYRFETSNADLYSKMRPGHILSDRIDALKKLKKMGYVIATGSIIGLPGQTVEDLANDILLMKELDTFMPSFGPLIPSKNTPLAGESKVDFSMVLKMIAISRLVMPRSRISVTTAMETMRSTDGRQSAFMAGANSVMFNLTPASHRDDYYIYEDKFFDSGEKYEKWALFKGELSYQMMEQELNIEI